MKQPVWNRILLIGLFGALMICASGKDDASSGTFRNSAIQEVKAFQKTLNEQLELLNTGGGASKAVMFFEKHRLSNLLLAVVEGHPNDLVRVIAAQSLARIRDVSALRRLQLIYVRRLKAEKEVLFLNSAAQKQYCLRTNKIRDAIIVLYQLKSVPFPNMKTLSEKELAVLAKEKKKPMTPEELKNALEAFEQATQKIKQAYKSTGER